MIESQPTASRPRNSRVPVAQRRQAAVRRSAASRPDLADGSRWKVQLELAPEEIAFVYRKGLARGAEVCRRGTHDWRPLVTTPELHDALAKRASLAEMIEVVPPLDAALTVGRTLSADPGLASLYSEHRSQQISKSAPPPPLVSKSAPPPPLVSKSPPPPPPVEADAQITLRQLKPLVNRDSVPDWEDTPLLPLRIVPTWKPKTITLPSARALAGQSVEPVVLHARPAELSLVAAVAVLLTLVVTALTLRAEAPKLNALITSARAGHTQPQPPAQFVAAGAVAPSTIPVVFWHDLPVEGARAAEGARATEGARPAEGARAASAVLAPSRASNTASFSAPPARPAASAGPNRGSLARALSGAAAAARNCGDGPVSAQVVVTFGPSGVARNIHFAAPPPLALRSCVLNAVARIRVAPFAGDPVTVSKTLRW